MDIKEAKKLKAKLESQIEEMIFDFESKTELYVEEVELNSMKHSDGSKVLYNVRIITSLNNE